MTPRTTRPTLGRARQQLISAGRVIEQGMKLDSPARVLVGLRAWLQAAKVILSRDLQRGAMGARRAVAIVAQHADELARVTDLGMKADAVDLSTLRHILVDARREADTLLASITTPVVRNPSEPTRPDATS